MYETGATLPPAAKAGDAPASAYSRISVMSGLSSPPAGVKNFRPLRKKGWWLAVICTAQSHGSSSAP